MSTASTWDFNGYDPKAERTIEALCTLGNGRFATRGAAPESPADAVHYPGTYAAGCYDRLFSEVAGERVGNEDMVNLPDWTRLRYRCLPDDGPAGDWLTTDDPSLRHHKVSLDLRGGVLTRRLFFQDGHGQPARRHPHQARSHGRPVSRRSENHLPRVRLERGGGGRVRHRW